MSYRRGCFGFYFTKMGAMAILMEDADSDEYRAVCAPEKPMSWRHPMVFAHLVAMAKSGRIVVAKAGLTSWRIFGSGEWGPTV